MAVSWRGVSIGVVTLGMVGTVGCLRLVDFEPPCEETRDVSSDPANCGACGRVCDTDRKCVDGQCVCESYKPADCNGTCRNLDYDSNHCGQCGNSCSGGYCDAGVCACSGHYCHGICADTAWSAAHCGGCDVTCRPGVSCENGVCMTPCVGVATPCELRTSATCESGGGCKLNLGCDGAVFCWGLSQSQCLSYSLCSWGQSCEGEPTPCEEIDACGSVPGCTGRGS